MATFSPRPTEFELPYFATREAYDQSLETAITANETAAGLAQDRADSAFDNAGSAQSTADAAGLAASGAQSTADQAVDDAAAAQTTANTGVANAATAQSRADSAFANAATAQATANAALPVKGILPVGPITNAVTPGVYFAYAEVVTPANGWPVTGGNWMVEVLPGAPTTVTQRITNVGGGDVKGFYYHRVQAGASNGWKFVPAQRIDNTAGRAIYTWDETQNREQLIYGDTGIRDVASLVENGWAVMGRLLLSRTGAIVTLIGDLIATDATDNTFLTLPNGFRFAGGSYSAANGLGGTTLTYFHAGALQSAYRGNRTGLSLTWRTTDPWPTTLPGTAFGTTPHN